MKKLYASLAIAAAALTAGTVTATAAQQVTPEGFVYNISDEGNASLYTVFPGMPAYTATEITIPATVNYNGADCPVVALEKGCLRNHAAVQKLVLGENVVFIGEGAVQGCKALTEVQFDDALRTIDRQAFYQCTSLGNVTLNEGLDSIGHYAFWQNQAVKSVTIPASVRGVGGNPWGECSLLEKVEVDAANEHLTAIGGVLFNKDVTTLICHPCAKYNFETGMVYTVPSTVKVLGSNSLRANPLMTECVMPEGLVEIGAQVFLGCSNMSKLTIPSTVTKIGNDAFLLLPKLKSFSIAEGNTSFRYENGMLLTGNNNELIYCLIASSDMAVPEGVTKIKAKAFQQKTDLVNITLPSTLKSIGDQVFANCTNLETVAFNPALQTIGANAFMGCAKLGAADLSGVMTIGAQAFAKCNMLVDVKFGPMLISLGQMAFIECWNIKSIELPGTIAVFGKGVFSNCQRMSSVTLGEGLTELPEGCFATNLLLEEVVMPSTMKRINADAFNYCVSLHHVTLNEGLEYVGNGAFTTCDLLELELPSTVTEIGSLSFSNNVNMEWFKAGEGLKTIGSGSFINNYLLAEATLNEGLESIGDDSFHGSGLLEIVIPESVTSIGKYAFNMCRDLEFIKNNAATPQVLTADLFNEEEYLGYRDVELRVPASSVDAYKTADIWSKFNNIIASDSGVEDIEAIGDVHVTDVYNLNGVRIEAPASGLNIIRTSDGKVRKVMVR